MAWKDLPPFTFEAEGQLIYLPVVGITDNLGGGIAKHKRVGVRGQKLDGMGGNAHAWTLEMCFGENIDEGVPVVLYPDECHRFCVLAEKQATGTLTLARWGRRRCKVSTYTCVEKTGEREFALVNAVFEEDNEEESKETALPSARAAMASTAVALTTELELEGISPGNLVAEIQELVASIEAYLAYPSDVASEFETTANALVTKCEKLVSTVNETMVRDVANPRPPGATAVRLAQRLADMAHRAKTERRPTAVRIIPYVVPAQTSLVAVASVRGMSFEDVMKLNPRLDPLLVPAGTPVLVHAA